MEYLPLIKGKSNWLGKACEDITCIMIKGTKALDKDMVRAGSTFYKKKTPLMHELLAQVAVQDIMDTKLIQSL